MEQTKLIRRHYGPKLTEEQDRKLRLIAFENRRSVGAEVAVAIEEYIRRHETHEK